jgi:hypothetical protein
MRFNSLRNGVKHFSFKFRSRKDKTQSITVLKKHWNHKTGFYADLFNSTFCGVTNNYQISLNAIHG